jgi:hypothetical protein
LANPGETISDLAKKSIIETCSYLKLSSNWVLSSNIYQNDHLKGKDRVLNICLAEGANVYINAKGGQELYDKDEFKRNNLDLFFVEPGSVEYNQMSNSFTPWLSIIDIMMFNDKDFICNRMLPTYNLI